MSKIVKKVRMLSDVNSGFGFIVRKGTICNAEFDREKDLEAVGKPYNPKYSLASATLLDGYNLVVCYSKIELAE
jgi:hypothetical protein